MGRRHGVQFRRIEQRHRGIRGADQQRNFGAAENNPFGTLCHQSGDDFAIAAARRIQEAAAAQFFENHAVDFLRIVARGSQNLEIVLRLQATTQNIRALHGELGTDETDAVNAGRRHRFAERIGDMQDRHGHSLFERGHAQMHGVGADEKDVGSGLHQALAGACQRRIAFVPSASALQRGDIFEIEGVHQDARRMHAAQLLLHGLVDQAVIGDGGFPTHPADQADSFHNPLR